MSGSQQLLLGTGVSAVANYIEDVFSTYLYTGQGAGSSQTITNGIDLSTKGGLVWLKNRNVAYNNNLFDTARGVNKRLFSNSTSAELNTADSLTAFNSNGFTIGTVDSGFSGSGENIASWTFRKQPKFFDVVTFTTASNAGATVAHSLGSTPGFVVVKSTADVGSWICWHRGLTSTNYEIRLNTTAAQTNIGGPWLTVSSTQVVFADNTGYSNLAANTSYVMYVFAHNAGGFGLTGTDNVISCGSLSGAGTTVNLGYEPQWILAKRTDTTGNWYIDDNMRGWPAAPGNDNPLLANTSDAEPTGYAGFANITSTGFTNNFNGDYIYIAIRRGPMKTPTSGTSVFLPTARSGNGTGDTKVTGASWPVDTLWISRRTGGGAGVGGFTDVDRLRGAGYNNPNSPLLVQNSTDAEQTSFAAPGLNGASGVQNQYILPGGSGYGLFNTSGVTYIDYLFARAPGFFDVVCYTGTGSATTFSHNLGVAPELMIVKRRDSAGTRWCVYSAATTSANILFVDTNAGSVSSSNWNNTAPTASVFSVGTSAAVNASGGTYVAYLFASCPGVSKVGSYTGTGTTLQIDCGFTAGSRFVLIKRTDSTGDWYVWDSARGIVAGNDPYLLLNSTAAEVTSTDYVDTYSAGFEISSTAPAAINANGGTFIFLAIA